MKLSIGDFDFLNSFDLHFEEEVDTHGKNKINLFSLKINSNDFDYKLLQNNLIDPMINFAVSRRVKAQLNNKPGTLYKKANQKFVSYLKNKGELGELLLYCFLETHLRAPKILSKLELKTSNNMYVNGSDGIHLLQLDNGNYQIIFGESKTVKDITAALSEAFESIYQFKNEINDKEEEKSGITYEKSLISDHLLKETFSQEEQEYLEKIIYPRRENTFAIDDAFGIFIGYEITISESDRFLPNDAFRKKVSKQICDQVKKRYKHIEDKIKEYKLYGHNFYIYVVPFTELEKNRVKIQKEIFR